MNRRPGSASVETRKGFCYLTVKAGRSNYNIMRIRNHTLEPQDKCDMCRLYPDYLFDWKRIDQQFTEEREVCQVYRSKRQAPRSAERTPEPLVMVSYDPRTRMVCISGTCDLMALLDAVPYMECARKK